MTRGIRRAIFPEQYRAAGRALLPPLMLLALFAVIFTCAWQSDDAYITFRTVRNAWAGHGLRWNLGERVQSYSHPLWMVISLGLFGVFREVYYSTLALSMALTMAAAAIIVRGVRREPWPAGLALLLLAVSGAFVDYATSGLETPLLYLLLALLLGLEAGAEPRRRLLLASLVASAIGLTRLDALVMVLPPLLCAWWQVRPRRPAAGIAVIGLLPLLGWELFSLVYYGSLVPNTALAKLNLAIPQADLLRQGFRYVLDSLAHDPVTLPVIVVAIAVVLRRGSSHHRAIAAGLILYLLSVLRAGGDFMSGRFFAAPYLAAVGMLAADAARHPPAGRPSRVLRPLLLAALLLHGVAWPESRWRSGADYGVGRARDSIVRPSGIADERAYYYPTTGLLRLLLHGERIARPGEPFPPYPGAVRGRDFARSGEALAVVGEAGFFGYFSGGHQTIIDAWALCDPFLSRIPYRPAGSWRIGHYPRRIPAGYLESRRQGRNLVQDPDLARAYEGLLLMTTGPLFRTARWREIWRFNTGYYRSALEKRVYP